VALQHASARSLSKRSNPLIGRYLPLATWTGIGLTSVFFVPASGTWATVPIAEWIIGFAAIGFGCWGFWRHGGRQITAAGLLCLSCAVMVGYTGIYWANNLSGAFPVSLYVATLLCYFSTLAMYALFWVGTEASFPQVELPVESEMQPFWAIRAGLVLVAAGIFLAVTHAPGNPELAGVAFDGVLLLSLGLVSLPGRSPLRGLRAPIAGVAFLLYYSLIFTGAGRLIVATLGLGIIAVLCRTYRGRFLKGMVLIAAPPALLYAGLIRSKAPTSSAVAQNGFDSIVTPLSFFGKLIALNTSGQLRLGHGSTFVATAVAFVPRSLWAGKPIGFGAVLTQIFQPALASSNQSLAGLAAGEWYFDFGLVGIVVMVMALGAFVALIDRKFLASLGRPLDARGPIIVRLCLIILVVGFPDLYWVGTFTYVARLLPRIAVVGILYALCVWKVPRVRRTPPARSRVGV
jgi:hypothetical protein